MEIVFNGPDESRAQHGDEAPPGQRRLQVSARLSGITAYTFLQGGAMVVIVAVMLVHGLMNLTSIMGLFVLAFSPVVLIIWLLLFGETATAIVDRLRTQPVLIIDRDSLFDRRQTDAPVSWSSVARARLVDRLPHTGCGVMLTLRHAIAARHNPLRYGVRDIRWQRPPDQLYVPLLSLDVASQTLAQIILDLVREHGGEIDTAPP